VLLAGRRELSAEVAVGVQAGGTADIVTHTSY